MGNTLQLGDVELRADLGWIHGPRERSHLEPRAVDVLLLLCSRPGEVFSRDQILQAVWTDASVNEAAVTRCISDIRNAFRKASNLGSVIETVPKRGYRLNLEVAVEGSVFGNCGDCENAVAETVLTAILEGTAERIFVLAPDGTYLHTSRTAAGALGFDRQQMAGKTWRDLGLPTKVMAPFEAHLERVVKEGTAVDRTVGYPTIDGTKHFQYRLRPILKAGQVCCVVAWVKPMEKPNVKTV